MNQFATGVWERVHPRFGHDTTTHAA